MNHFWLLALFLSLSLVAPFGVADEPTLEQRKKAFPCALDRETYCFNEKGPMILVCLNQLPKERLTEPCRRHLVETPIKFIELEQKFVEACEPYFKDCKDLAGDSIYGKISRRKCILGKIKTVSEACRTALDVHIGTLQPHWRPKDWKPSKK